MHDLIIFASFGFFLLLFTGIGVLSSRHKTESSEDYLVASRDVNPWLIALSAVSTNNSGYMFIGLIGFTWRSGIEAVWITFGWILGDLLTWFWVHKRVRDQSEAVDAASVPALLATRKDGKINRPIAIVTGLLTLLFLGGYAAAQLKAGSTTLHALFDWPIWLGSVIGVIIVAVYCLSGGIRASIWTDAAQSIVMMGAMAVLLAYCAITVGGPGALMDALTNIDPALTDPIPNGLAFGLGLYVLGFVFAGMATVGQPHILVRFMAIDSSDSIRKARVVYFAFYTVFSAAAMVVGLYARVIMPDLGAGLSGAELATATEGALPLLTVKLLPALLIGLMLAGLFSATMSTADSQILSCSAAVTQDIMPRWSRSYLAGKIATLGVATLALIIALTADSGVFSLVLMAWSVLGAALGPVLVVRLAGRPLPTTIAMLMMASGIATVVLWPYPDSIFKVMPGLIVPLVLYAAASPFLGGSGGAREAEAAEAVG